MHFSDKAYNCDEVLPLSPVRRLLLQSEGVGLLGALCSPAPTFAQLITELWRQ